MKITLSAPVDGYIIPLAEVPDPVFSQKMVGDGFAIEPFGRRLCCPIDGVIKSVAKTGHAITIDTEKGADVLIHLGLETVTLKGQGIKPMVEVGQRVSVGTPMLEFDLDFVSKNAKSLITPILVTDCDVVSLELIQVGVVKKRKPVCETVISAHANHDATDTDSVKLTREITVVNANGIHARPAAVISGLSKQFDAKVTLHYHGQKASLSSIVSLLGLAVAGGEKITLEAVGNDAQNALDALENLILSLKDEEHHGGVEEETPSQQKRRDGNRFIGNSASKGLVIAQLQPLQEVVFEYDEQTKTGKVNETQRMRDALAAYQRDLREKIQFHHKDKTQVELLEAHLELLDDSSLLQSLKDYIGEEKTAEFAWQQAIQKAIEVLKSTGNKLLIERVADLKDIRKQVMQLLVGHSGSKQTYHQPTILVTDEFTLSDVLSIDENVVGLISEKGGITSHVAIIANNKGVPLLINADPSIYDFVGQTVILNTLENYAIVSPDEAVLAEHQQKIADRQALQAEQQQQALAKATTKDGIEINCYMNIKSAEDTDGFAQTGAEGVGLFRTEFVFYDRPQAPTEDEQLAIYNQALVGVGEHPLIIRTLDAGGDKQIDYLHMPHEMNPFLGVRGVRLCLRNPALFKAQLRAIIRTQNPYACIMFPMITTIAEYREAKALYEAERKALGIEVKQPLGIMVEVPSVVMQAPIFAKEVDFMSVGTNDLTQYILAMDREHQTLASETDHLNPAVLNALAQTSQAAQQYGTKLSVCGMMASDNQAVPILIGLGIYHLSMRKNTLAENKAIIRELDFAHCQRVAQQALALEDAQQVRQLVEKEFNLK